MACDRVRPATSPVNPRLLVVVTALTSLVVGGCSAPPAMPPPANSGANDLVAPTAGKGVQYRMVTQIPAGADVERCQFFVAPPEGITIGRELVKYVAGSHHVLLYTTDYKSVPTKGRDGQAIDTSGVFDCLNGPNADWDLTGLVALAQSPDAPPIVDLPPGIAFSVAPGAVLLMNTHYVNASPKAVDTDVRVNLYTVPRAEVKQEAGVLFFYNPFIRVPASGEASARMSCPVTRDITLLNLQSHMHRRAVNHVADLSDDKGQRIETLFQGKEWEGVKMATFPGGKPLKAGTAIDYRCDYKNPEDRMVKQGAKSSDEMCMSIGLYYPKSDSLEHCRREGLTMPSSAATYIGSGTANCLETLLCSVNSKSEGDFYGCVVDSCAANARQVTAVLQCRFAVAFEPNGVCRKQCSGPDTKDCSPCIQAQCKAQIDGCTAARCS